MLVVGAGPWLWLTCGPALSSVSTDHCTLTKGLFVADAITLADVNAGLGSALALLSALQDPKAKSTILKEIGDELAKVQKERAAFSEEIKEYRAYLRQKRQFDKDKEQLEADQAKLAADQEGLRGDRGAFTIEVKTTRDELDEAVKAVAGRETAVAKGEASLKRRLTQCSKREKAIEETFDRLRHARITIAEPEAEPPTAA